MLIVLVALLGAVGAVTRSLVDSWSRARFGGEFPIGTLVINVSGSFVLGLLTGLTLYHGFSPAARVELGTGFCGGYTTFSTFAWESVRLAGDGYRREAAWNVASSVVLPLAAAAIGVAILAW